MSKVIAVHSFRRGAGKSTLAANLAAIYAVEGHSVGVIDTDFHSPTIHFPFHLDEADIYYSLNDFLWGRCTARQCTYDVTNRMTGMIKGQVCLMPGSTRLSEVNQILREGVDVRLLDEGLREISHSLGLDLIVLDTCAGLNEDTMAAIALSTTLGLILRPDQQDYQGTAVTLDIAHALEIPNIFLITNMVPSAYDLHEVRDEVAEKYHCEVAAVLPFVEEMTSLGSRDIFALCFPGHPLSGEIMSLARRLVP
ncbi:MAG: MinD/ParA family protein [Chloroflexota bacterium]|nr:MAG: MinD/ParA family protein [Chloroflexota bacterium]